MGNVSTLSRDYTGSINRAGKPGIGLVLQGGGAYAGPYTAGFLCGLQRRGFFEQYEILGVSATSAGALNARVFFQSADYAYNAQRLRWLWDTIGYTSMPADYTSKFLKSFDLVFAAAAFFSGCRFQSQQAAETIAQACGASMVPDVIKALVGGMTGPAANIAAPLHINACHKENGRLQPLTYSGTHTITADHIAAACALKGHYCDGLIAYDGAYLANTQIEPLINDPGIPDILVIAAYPAWGPVNPVHPAILRAMKSDRMESFATDEIHQEIAYHARREKARLHVAQPVAFPADQAHLNIDLATQQAFWNAGEADALAWLERHAANIGRTPTLPYKKSAEKVAPQHIAAL